MKTIWRGNIQFSLVTIPVRLFNAADAEEGIKFNQIHRGCHGLIGTNRYCKKCNAVIESKDIVRGFEYAPSLYVVIDDEDLNAIKTITTKIIDIQGFVSSREVHPSLYETPYFLGPDGEIALESYALLRDAMRDCGKVGVAKVVIREKEETVILNPEENGILLYKLRSPQQLRYLKDIPDVEKTNRPINEENLLIAKAIISSTTISLANIDLADNYQKLVMKMIRAKIDGTPLVSASEVVYPVVDLKEALEKSFIEISAKTNTVKAERKNAPKKDTTRRSRVLHKTERFVSNNGPTEEKKKSV